MAFILIVTGWMHRGQKKNKKKQAEEEQQQQQKKVRKQLQILVNTK